MLSIDIPGIDAGFADRVHPEFHGRDKQDAVTNAAHLHRLEVRMKATIDLPDDVFREDVGPTARVHVKDGLCAGTCDRAVQ